ncbi:hypothetical protein NIA13_17680, partial [Oscillibacter valericigenes]|nr:hypothetical protein [Oscillibacter valericigenes]
GKRISQYTCSQYSKVPVGKLCTTQHRINEDVVLSLVSEMLKAVALNGSYIETGTYNGEVIYGCDESTIRNAAKKYAEQLGPHY